MAAEQSKQEKNRMTFCSSSFGAKRSKHRTHPFSAHGEKRKLKRIEGASWVRLGGPCNGHVVASYLRCNPHDCSSHTDQSMSSSLDDAVPTNVLESSGPGFFYCGARVPVLCLDCILKGSPIPFAVSSDLQEAAHAYIATALHTVTGHPITRAQPVPCPSCRRSATEVHYARRMTGAAPRCSCAHTRGYGQPDQGAGGRDWIGEGRSAAVPRYLRRRCVAQSFPAAPSLPGQRRSGPRTPCRASWVRDPDAIVEWPAMHFAFLRTVLDRCGCVQGGKTRST